ncbi:MAG: DUF4920 domain-containing protein [Acidobacteriota bacterium]
MDTHSSPRRLWRPVAVAAIAALAFAVTPAAADAGANELTTQTYGAGLAEATAVPIADLVASPDQWRGQAVQVEGEIRGVCPKKGCWMELVDGDARVRVKVEDDVIIFPADAIGKRAVAQGTVEIRDMSREAYAGWLRHLAEENGESFDAASVGDGPFQLIQIRGTGAEING